MSISASIDIFLLKNDKYYFSVKDLIQEMQKNGWNIKKDGKICYLPLQDELFNWTEHPISETEWMEIVFQKEQNNEIIGVMFYWKNTKIGISMLVFPDGQITFQMTVNRLKLNSDITNVNWYLKKIMICFDKFKVTEITFNQTWQ